MPIGKQGQTKKFIMTERWQNQKKCKNIIERKNRENLEELDRFTRASEKTLKETKGEMKADQEALQKDWQNEKESIFKRC